MTFLQFYFFHQFQFFFYPTKAYGICLCHTYKRLVILNFLDFPELIISFTQKMCSTQCPKFPKRFDASFNKQCQFIHTGPLAHFTKNVTCLQPSLFRKKINLIVYISFAFQIIHKISLQKLCNTIIFYFCTSVLKRFTPY